jgi:WD40 repeat protein
MPKYSIKWKLTITAVLLCLILPVISQSTPQESIITDNGYDTVNLKRVIKDIHSKTINDVEYDPKHGYFVTCSDDDTVGIFNFNTGENIDYLYEYYNSVRDVSLNSKYSLMATADNDGFIMVYKYPEIVKLEMIYAHNYSVSSVIFTYDNKRLISAGDDGLVKIWDVRDNFNIIHIIEAHDDYITNLACDRQSRYLVTASEDNTLKVFDLSTFQLIHTLEGHIDYIRGVDITPNGEYIVSGDDSGMIIVWKTSTGKIVHKLTRHDDFIRCIKITPEGNRFIACSDDKTVTLWHIQSGRLVRVYTGLSDWVYSGDITPDREFIITVNDDYRAEILPYSIDGFRKAITDSHFSSEQLYNKHPAQINIKSLFHRKDFSEDITAISDIDKSGKMVTGYSDGSISIWEVGEKGIKGLSTIQAHDAYIDLLKVTPHGSYIVSSSYDRSVRIHNINGSLDQYIDTRRKVSDFVISADSVYLIYTDISPAVYVWDMERRAYIYKLKLQTQPATLSISSDGSSFLIGYTNGLVESYDLSSGDLRMKLKMTFPIRHIISLSDRLILTDGQSIIKMVQLTGEGHATHDKGFPFYSTIRLLASVGDTNIGIDRKSNIHNGYILTLDEYGILIIWHISKDGILPVRKVKISQTKVKHAVYDKYSLLLLTIDENDKASAYRLFD